MKVKVSISAEQDMVPMQYELLTRNCFGMLDDQMHNIVEVIFA